MFPGASFFFLGVSYQSDSRMIHILALSFCEFWPIANIAHWVFSSFSKSDFMDTTFRLIADQQAPSFLHGLLVGQRHIIFISRDRYTISRGYAGI